MVVSSRRREAACLKVDVAQPAGRIPWGTVFRGHRERPEWPQRLRSPPPRKHRPLGSLRLLRLLGASGGQREGVEGAMPNADPSCATAAGAPRTFTCRPLTGSERAGPTATARTLHASVLRSDLSRH